jgi:serine---pyruvate transaminase
MVVKRKYSLNMSCGQTSIFPSTLAAMATQCHEPIYYKPYYDLEVACVDQLRRLLHTKNDVLMILGTGTYGIEAAMLSVLESGDNVLTVNTGTFGALQTDLARIARAVPTEIVVAGGKSVTVEEIRRALKKNPAIKMAAVAYTETSRGSKNPVAAIGRMLQNEFPHVVYLVDAMSSFAAVELYVDEWGIDILCTTTQKALNAPQGIAIVAVSSKAWQVMEARQTPIASLCLDLTHWRTYHANVKFSQESWSVPNSPAKTPPRNTRSIHGPSGSYVLTKALKASMDEIEGEGEEGVFRRHQVASCALREGIRAMGFQTLTSDDNSSPTATCVDIGGDEFDLRYFTRMMYEKYSIVTSGGSPTRASGSYAGFRVGTMGQSASSEYVFAFLAALEDLMPTLGYKVNEGAALPAAQAIFAAG